MPKYANIKKIYLPLNVYKTERTVSIANDGRKVFGGIGNEGLDIGLWIQEKIDDGTIVTGGVDLSALIALTGMPAGSSDLNTFTGSIIPDNSTIKEALQELETFIESSIAYTDEEAQDAIGTILLDSATIDFTYNDGTPSITASVINNSITFAKMQQISTQKLLGRSTAGTGNVEEITLGSNLQLSGGVLDLSFTPTSGTVTSVALSLPSFITVSGSPVTSTGTLTGTLATQIANTVFAGPTTGANAQPTFRALVSNDIPTLLSTKISDFNEAVDDRVNALLVAGTNITLTYNDGSNTLTIDASDSSYTTEEAQDAIGSILVDTDTINFIYNDGTPSITASVNTQMSITSDASGLKLLGDESSPGNLKYYGTDNSGVKGFYSLSSFSLPSGISTQTLRYDGTNTLVANSNLLNDGTYVAIGGSIITGIRLFVNGAIRNTGVFYSRGAGGFGASSSSSELRLENTTSGQTWYMHSANTGELLISTNSVNPEITIDTSSDVIIANKLKIGDTTPTPETLIGIDSNGYIGEITLGEGLTLVGGELAAPSVAGSLPSATTAGQIIYWDGSDWLVALQYKEIQEPSPGGDQIVLPSIPISELGIDVYLNGVLQEETDDYTIISDTITFNYNFITNDKVIVKYFA